VTGFGTGGSAARAAACPPKRLVMISCRKLEFNEEFVCKPQRSFQRRLQDVFLPEKRSSEHEKLRAQAAFPSEFNKNLHCNCNLQHPPGPHQTLKLQPTNGEVPAISGLVEFLTRHLSGIATFCSG
jgi:hypothetical protein